MKLLQQPDHFKTVRRVEVAGRLVREDDLRVSTDGAGDREPLTLPTRERPSGSSAPVQEAQARERPRHALALFLGAPAADAQRHRGIALDRIIGKHVRRLEDEAEHSRPQLITTVVPQRTHVSAVNAVAARGRLIEEPEDVEESRLARS
ncbi:hypothetical protein ACVLV4_002462 [Rathayibacter agropyri]